MEAIRNLLKGIPSELMLSGNNNRVKYAPFDMDISLQVVERIGKSIDPLFVLNNNATDLYTQLIYYYHADDRFEGNLEKGLLLQGPTGTGKTMAMKIMRAYREIDDIKIIVNGKYYKLIYDITNVSHVVSGFIENSFDGIQSYTNRYIICLDDIGTETETVKYYGNELDVIGHIISERFAKSLLTFGTTNFPIGELEKRYDDRIISRFYALFNFMVVKDRDYRRG